MLKRILIFSLIIINVISCDKHYNAKKFEGFAGESLKVYVYEFIPEHESNPDEKNLSILTEKLNNRSFQILACYVSINLKREKVSPENDHTLNQTVNDIISKGRITQYDCFDNGYCEAFAEYNVKDLFEVIQILNK